MTAPNRSTGPDRDWFIAVCIDLADRLRDVHPALWQLVNERLAAVGITCVLADGETLDRDNHEVLGAEPTTDPALDYMVAHTEFAGYRDGTTWLRRPRVTVLRFSLTDGRP